MEARLYKALKDQKVQCNLCKHFCIIKNGSRGICNVRENQEGVLKTLIYGNLIARNVDPIEKKPLFHFFPGSLSLSVASVGCNFKCLFCQNADIAQMPSDRNGLIMGDFFKPDEIVKMAKKRKCKSIAYTYTEPTVNFEFVLDTARLAAEKGIKNVLITNGYISDQALKILSPYIDAANVDLKAFNNEFYTKKCNAELENVQKTLIQMKSSGIFLEITTLIIPGLNDNPDEIQKLALFIAESLGRETPWHVSRFHPAYKLCDRPGTPVETLNNARKTGLKTGLKYVYTGNVHGSGFENTLCCNCGKLLIKRSGFMVEENFIVNGSCPDCNTKTDGLF